ncbi:hypothetical protein Cpir12675_000116 [Ceratocystis pirilliformis]|uniref:Uncharacterized protein n=1 Tax=Ceratocystis pirilliformis TaxID=259994 RepID=A0ABR3ZQ51_9PEZI
MPHDQFMTHETHEPPFLQPTTSAEPLPLFRPPPPPPPATQTASSKPTATLISTTISDAPTSAFVTAPPSPASRWWDASVDYNAPHAGPEPDPPLAPMGSCDAFFRVFLDNNTTTASRPDSTAVVPFSGTAASAAPLASGPASALGPTQPSLNLPSGQCNFVDLTLGGNGAKCGCRRFYSSCDALKSEPTEFCMCMHHACFHDHSPSNASTNAPAQQLDTPASYFPPPPLLPPHSQLQSHIQPSIKTPRIAQSPLQDISSRFSQVTASRPPMLPPSHRPSTSASHAACLHPPPPPPPRPLIDPRNPKTQSTSIPDTLGWNSLGTAQLCSKNDSISTNIAPARQPSSQLSTTTTSSSFFLPFGGKGAHLIGALGTKAREPLRDKLHNKDETTVEQSSILKPKRPTCDSMATTCSDSEVAEPAKSLSKTFKRPSNKNISSTESPSKENPNMDLKNLTDMVNSYEHRLDRLENASVITSMHEECNERHESLDLRLYDLETRVEDVEKLVNDNSFKGGQDSMSSDGYGRADLVSRIEALQAQINLLQNTVPSIWQPWEVDVVFLPFALHKIWLPSHEFKINSSLDSLPGTDSWISQPPGAYSLSSSHRPQSPFCQDWGGDEDGQDWLLPRAYRIDSLLDKRLRSRGCIRRISVKGPDARSVQIAINASFAGLLGSISAQRKSQLSLTRTSKFMGLQQDWVPLRKIHKDSRLRFLTPAELITPATWDVVFLKSVLMKSSQPRLFITQPEAYVQDHIAFDLGWTWQRLRELSRFYSEDSESQEVGEADALEECWTWNDLLDGQSTEAYKPWLRDSLISPASHRNPAHSQASRYASSPLSSSRGQTPNKVVKAPSRTMLGRTASVPPVRHVPSYSFPSASAPDNRRRMTCHDGHSQSPIRTSFARRRPTRSPSNRAHPTPRWSSGPPSPRPFALNTPTPDGTRAVSSSSSKGSRATAFNYATPHSNTTAPAGANAKSDADTDIARANDGDTFMTEDSFSINGDSDSGPILHNHHDNLRQALQSHAASFHGHSPFHSQHPKHEFASDDPASWHQLPEDEPWPGIEDHVSACNDADGQCQGQNKDEGQDQSQDHAIIFRQPGSKSANGLGSTSDASSSQPSEYPSIHPNHGGFHIHEDEDEDENMIL